MRRLVTDMRPRARWASALLLGAVVLLAAFMFVRQMKESVTTRDVIPVLRLSPQQLLLNWQSFPGRTVMIEYCTVRVLPDGELRCVLIDGAREAGYVELDRKTVEPATADWAAATCSGKAAARACTTRVTGVLRRGPDGRAFLEQAISER
jgi:hypothetical protein